MDLEPVIPGLCCAACEKPFQTLLARITPEGYVHTGTCPRYCQIEGCDALHRSKGYCNPHYMAWKAHGDPLAAKRLTPDHVEDIEFMFEHGETLEGVAKRLNRTVSGVQGFLREQKRADLLAAFATRAAIARGVTATEPDDADFEFEDVA